MTAPPTTEQQPIGSGVTATTAPPPELVELPNTGAGVELTAAVAVVLILSGLGLRKGARR